MKLKLFLKGSLGKLETRRVRKVVKGVLIENGLDGRVEVSVTLVGEAKMRQLNKQHRGKDEVTDVLSFPLEKDLGPDKVTRLGDVVVCWQVAEKQAKDKKVGVEMEVDFLISHGMLHLLGVHHD